MNWDLGQLECDFCKDIFNCSIGLSNKNTPQVFGFCCPHCSGILSIEIDPIRSTNRILKNVTAVGRKNKDIFNVKSIRLHLDFPALLTNGWSPFTPFNIACLGLKEGYNIEHFKVVTSELNFYSEHILVLQSLFNFYKNSKIKELYHTSRTLLREDFDIVIGVDSDYIDSISVIDYITSRDVDIIFYKTLFGISIALNKGMKPDHDIKELSSYLSGLKKEKLCEFHSYLSNNRHLKDSIKTTNKIYSNIYSNEEFFRPSIFLSDYSSTNYKKEKSPLRLVSEKVEVILNIYKDLTEVISKQYILIVGLRNIEESDNYDTFKINYVRTRKGKVSINNIAEFSELDLGMKARFMKGSYFEKDLKIISNKIRNSIAHNNWEYNELSQEVLFRFNKGINDAPKEKDFECKTILEINSEIINLFRLMHKLNIIYYLFGCFYGRNDWDKGELDNI